MEIVAVGVVVALLLAAWFLWRRTERVPCALDLERTHEHMHAHLELMGFLPEPGDSVQMERPPERLEYGTRDRVESEAVVTRASWLRRKWTRVIGALEFYELYDVGFE